MLSLIQFWSGQDVSSDHSALKVEYDSCVLNTVNIECLIIKLNPNQLDVFVLLLLDLSIYLSELTSVSLL